MERLVGRELADDAPKIAIPDVPSPTSRMDARRRCGIRARAGSNTASLEAEVGELLSAGPAMALFQLLLALTQWIRSRGVASLLLVLDELPEFQDVQFVRRESRDRCVAMEGVGGLVVEPPEKRG